MVRPRAAELAVRLEASHDSGDDVGRCGRWSTITYTAAIEVDRAARVTYRWDLDDDSSSHTATFGSAGRKVIHQDVLVRGWWDDEIEGDVTLTVSVDGGDRIVKRASYELSCW